MELRQLEYFRAIVDCGTISEAARRLHMTQPPLSYQMHQLEDELGVSLFARGSRRIELTEAGSVLYRRASSLLDYSDSVEREIHSLGSSQTLHIGSTPTTVSVMVPLLRRYASLNPKVRFEVYDGNTFHLKELLGNGVIDICLIRTPVDLQEFRSRKIRSEKMLALEAPEGRARGGDAHGKSLRGEERCEGLRGAAGQNSGTDSQAPNLITLEELAGRPLVIYRRYQDLIMETFLRSRLSPQILCECDDARTAIQFAREGLGTAVVPESIAADYPSMHKYIIDSKDLETDILLAWRDENVLVRELVKMID